MPKEFAHYKRTNIYLTGVQIKQLHAISKKIGLSTAEIVRRAIDEYLERRGHEETAKR